MPFTRRVLAGFAAVAAVVLGLGLTSPSPAAAATGAWALYGNTNPITSSPSTWKCNDTRTVATNVGAQVCAVRSFSGTSTQGAVIVRNNRSSGYAMTASVSVYLWNGGYLDTWYCSESTVRPNSWSVCFGKTMGESYMEVYASGFADGVSLGASPNA